MSYEYNVETLTRRTRAELVQTIKDEIQAFDDAEENYGEGEGINHIGNIERVAYVLRNCDYEGRQ